MRGLAVLLALSLAACGGGGITAPSEPAPRLYFTGTAAAHVTSSMATWAEEEFDTQAACVNLQNRFKYPIEVEVFPNYFICASIYGGAGVMANGCAPSLGRIQVNVKTFEGSLSHELLHVMTQKNGWPPDGNHTSPIWKQCDRLNNPSAYGVH